MIEPIIFILLGGIIVAAIALIIGTLILVFEEHYKLLGAIISAILWIAAFYFIGRSVLT